MRDNLHGTPDTNFIKLRQRMYKELLKIKKILEQKKPRSHEARSLSSKQRQWKKIENYAINL